MKTLLALLLAVCTLTATAQADRKDRIIASYLIAFGQPPTQGEIDFWMTDPASNQSVQAMVARHRVNMQTMGNLEALTIQNSYLAVFGRTPEPGETEFWRNDTKIFVELVEAHKGFLQKYPDERRKMIRLSYLQGMNREPKKAEVDWWMSQPLQTNAEIKAQHIVNRQYEPEWNRITVKDQSKLQRATLTSTVKKEMVSTLNSTNTSSLINKGVTCISTGGANVIATGGGNVIATGGGNVIATGGLN